ncbi:hypothetical protein Tco_0456345, partial [Tanacetum coccineum]
VRIYHKSQENSQNRANTDTGIRRAQEKPKIQSQSQKKSSLTQMVYSIAKGVFGTTALTIDVDVDNFKRCCTSYTFDVGYKVLRDFLLHRSSINNSARLSNKFGGFYFSFKFDISGLLHHVITTIAYRIRDKDTSQSKQNLQSSSMTFIHKTLIIPSVLDSCFISSTVSEVKRGEVWLALPINCLVWIMKYSANMRRTDVDFSHAPPNEYSPSPDDKKQWSLNLLKIGDVGLGVSRFLKLRPKGVYEESFSRHAA